MNKVINNTAFRFFLCLHYIILNNTFSLADLAEYLYKNYDLVLSKHTLLKYIRTLKYLEFSFHKTKDNYVLDKNPLCIDIPKDIENDLIECFKNLKKFYSQKNYDYTKTFNKVSKFISDQKIKKYLINNDVQNDSIQKYCTDKHRLQIEYCYNDKIINSVIEPQEIVIEKSITYLKCYDLSRKEIVLVKTANILKMKQLPTYNQFLFTKNNVTLRMSNPLLRAYTLKDGEKIIRTDENHSIIESFYYDKILFFKNILRYMDKCEILYPEALRGEFKLYLEELYQIYDCHN